MAGGGTHRFGSFSEATAGVLELLEQQLPGSAVFVGHLDGTEDRFRIVDKRGDASFDLEPGTAINLNESFCIRMVAGDAPNLSNDAAADPVYGQLASRDELNIRSYAGVPLEIADGARIGSLCAICHDPEAYTERDLQLLGVMANLLAFQLEQDRTKRELATLTDELRDQATRDHLTGLLNRRTFDDVLAREWELTSRDGIASYLLVFDLDSFKELNDTKGHAAGDAALRDFGDALRAAARKTDLVARLGGDEFAVVLVRCKAATTPDRFVRRLRNAIGRRADSPMATLGVSAGAVALADAESPEAALAAADAEMYADKQSRGAAR